MNHIYFAGYDAQHPDDFIFDVPEGYDCYLLLLTTTPARFWVNGQTEEYPAHCAILYPPRRRIWYGASGQPYGNDWMRFTSDEPFIRHFPLPACPFPVSDPAYCHSLFQLLIWENARLPEASVPHRQDFHNPPQGKNTSSDAHTPAQGKNTPSDAHTPAQGKNLLSDAHTPAQEKNSPASSDIPAQGRLSPTDFPVQAQEKASLAGPDDQIISQLLRILFTKLQSDVLHHAASPHDHDLLTLRRQILNAPQLPWSVSEMAAQLHVSPGHLHLLYKQKFGISCMDDVIDSRIRKAKDLLVFSDHSIAEIAYQAGYQNVEHFCRQFRRLTGQTPGSFRKEHTGP